MQSLRQKILGIQIKTFESKWYVPGKELNKVLSKSIVEEAISHCGVEAYLRKEAVHFILRGSKKIFAVLVLMGKEQSIVDFIEHDHLQNQRQDSKLPFRRSELGEILDDELAEEFCRTQWVVSAPYFRNDMSHRLLNEDTILPFSKNFKIGSGAFGTVFEITIDARHQGVWENGKTSEDTRLIRKEIDLPDISVEATDNPKREGHVLSLLKLIRHPNILRLIASYSYRGTYNLIFPRAAGDLGKYLSSNGRRPCFESDHTIILACQGLCGAVAALHHYISPDYNLHLKGYHHDLKPENILVDDANFLLSDFGLSSLKDLASKSKTLYKEVRGFYIAPECQSMEEDFEKHMIGQPADVWALGCILTVIFTHMQMGMQGIQEFEQNRKSTMMNWTTYSFHTAGKLNSAVSPWLDKLEHNEGEDNSGFCKLIRLMLQVEPSRRPSAQNVFLRMTFLAAKVLYDLAKRKLGLLSDLMNHTVISIEHLRLIIFGDAIGINENDRDWNDIQQLFSEKLEFDVFKKSFLDLNQLLDAAIENQEMMRTSEPSHTQLRSCIDQFWNLLSFDIRFQCEDSLERKLIHSDDLHVLQTIENEIKEGSDYKKFGLLAAIKCMTKLAENCQIQNPSLRWDPRCISTIGTNVNLQTMMARVKPENVNVEKDVLIHKIKYNATWTAEIGKELYSRIEAIAELLHRSEKPSRFRALDCIGYYHIRSEQSFGLVFDLPVNPIQGNLDPRTLLSIIQTFRNQDQQPSLGDRFCLAQHLALGVYEWHKVGWLHKNIWSCNVILFPHAFVSPAASITEPYVIGFNHARQDEKNAFSHGPPVTPEQIDYCHPKYLKDRWGYRREYDYYSLGLVLLEIGLWRALHTLSASLNGDDRSSEKLREFLLSKYVVRLRSLMGEIYENAVRACLTFDVNAQRGQEGDEADVLLEEFRAKVVAPLRKCFA